MAKTSPKIMYLVEIGVYGNSHGYETCICSSQAAIKRAKPPGFRKSGSRKLYWYDDTTSRWMRAKPFIVNPETPASTFPNWSAARP